VLLNAGRDSAAGAAGRRALALEPDRAITLHTLGLNAYAGRRYDEARRWLDSAVAVDPGFYRAYALRARVLLQFGDVAGARRDAEVAVHTGAGDPSVGEGALALVEAATGDTLGARLLVDRRLREASSPKPWAGLENNRYTLAGALVALGEHERALDYLEQIRPRNGFLWLQLTTPEFDPIRDHPRFRRLIEESRPPGAQR
jgi:adenylate cyclase